MASRAVRDREQEQHEQQADAGAQGFQMPVGHRTQYTARGAVPPVQTDMNATPAGPSASERAFGPSLGAVAYTSGAEPHLAGGHVPVAHEVAHVVQQAQGRVAKPALEAEGPEHEADETRVQR